MEAMQVIDFIKAVVQPPGRLIVDGFLAEKGARIQEEMRRRALDKKIEDLCLRLEQDGVGTVIETDAFQNFCRNYRVCEQIGQYVWHPETQVSREKFFEELLSRYADSGAGEKRRTVSSGEERQILRFFDAVMTCYREALHELMSDSDRAAVGMVNERVFALEGQMEQALSLQTGQIKELLSSQTEKIGQMLASNDGQGRMESVQSALRNTAAGSEAAEPESPSAAVFRRRFRRRLFLEEKDGPALNQVFLWPKCRAGGPETVDGLEATEAFLRGSEPWLLVVEGVAGSGKSSFLSALSERYHTSQYIYKSLRDLGGGEKIDFRRELLAECSLTADDMDKILILDGYDEIHHRVNQTAFWADMKWFEEHGYKVILTTRPGYLKVPETWGDYAEISLRLFDEEQTKEWLSRYQEAGGRILPETFRALTEPQPDEKYDEIRRIPIMLYVIANRNINVQTVTCMGELYERVFEGMKRDKAGLTAETLDRHYLIAQKIAYEMERKGVLAVSSETARQWCGDLFDETFFSSVYIENSIIEGRWLLEFVHRSILEFFAARWIFGQLRGEENLRIFGQAGGNGALEILGQAGGNGALEILGRSYLSDEVLEYLKYFMDVTRHTSAEEARQCVRKAFHDFMEIGILTDGSLSTELAEAEYDMLFCNLAVLTKFALNQNILGEVLEPEYYGKNLSFLIRNYLHNGLAKPWSMRNIFEGEDLSKLYEPTHLGFAGHNLERVRFCNCTLRHVDFYECRLKGARFEHVIFRRCDFVVANLTDARFVGVEFDLVSLDKIRFCGVWLCQVKMPQGALEIRYFDHAHLSEVQFSYNTLKKVSFEESELTDVVFDHCFLNRCTFRGAVWNQVEFRNVTLKGCDFSEVDAERGCFRHCKIDGETRASNPGLFL